MLDVGFRSVCAIHHHRRLFISISMGSCFVHCHSSTLLMVFGQRNLSVRLRQLSMIYVYTVAISITVLLRSIRCLVLYILLSFVVHIAVLCCTYCCLLLYILLYFVVHIICKCYRISVKTIKPINLLSLLMKQYFLKNSLVKRII